MISPKCIYKFSAMAGLAVFRGHANNRRGNHYLQQGGGEGGRVRRRVRVRVQVRCEGDEVRCEGDEVRWRSWFILLRWYWCWFWSWLCDSGCRSTKLSYLYGYIDALYRYNICLCNSMLCVICFSFKIDIYTYADDFYGQHSRPHWLWCRMKSPFTNPTR